MDCEVWPDPRIVRPSQKYVCVSVDLDRPKERLPFLGIQFIPTIIIADPQGTQIIRREGYAHTADLATDLKVIPADFSEAKPSLEPHLPCEQ